MGPWGAQVLPAADNGRAQCGQGRPGRTVCLLKRGREKPCVCISSLASKPSGFSSETSPWPPVHPPQVLRRRHRLQNLCQLSRWCPRPCRDPLSQVSSALSRGAAYRPLHPTLRTEARRPGLILQVPRMSLSPEKLVVQERQLACP